MNDARNQAAWIRDALDRYEQPLLRYANSITRDVERARDVVQETFLKLCRADRAQVEDHLAPWLYTVTRNHALNVRKKEQRMNPLDDTQAALLPDSKAGPAATAAANEAQANVFALIATLPPEQQEACRLKFQDDLTYREISDVMGVSLGKVSKLIAGALEVLREQLRSGTARTQEA